MGKILVFRPGGGGGVLPCKGLMVMCRWMGSRFHDWIDYNGVAFLKTTFRVTTIRWQTFRCVWEKTVLHIYG